LEPFIRKHEDEAIFKQLSAVRAQSGTSAEVQAYVRARLDRLRIFFPLATAKQLCDSLQYYSPESNLIDVLGYKPVLPIADSGQKWVPGKLEYGSDLTFHGGVERSSGLLCRAASNQEKRAARVGKSSQAQVQDTQQNMKSWRTARTMTSIPMVFQVRPAREQKSYDEKGVL
jgi:hypothetical protein